MWARCRLWHQLSVKVAEVANNNLVASGGLRKLHDEFVAHFYDRCSFKQPTQQAAVLILPNCTMQSTTLTFAYSCSVVLDKKKPTTRPNRINPLAYAKLCLIVATEHESACGCLHIVCRF